MLRKKGEAYIDTIITIFLSVVLIYVACSVFSVIYTYQRINSFANKFSEYISLHGCTSSSEINDIYLDMIDEYGLNSDVLLLSFNGTSYIDDIDNQVGAVQYGNKIVVSLQYTKNVGFLNDVGFISVPVSVKKIVLSQNYWKTGSYEDEYDNTQIRYLIIKDFENMSAAEQDFSVIAGNGLTLTLTPDENYILPESISVYIGEYELINGVDYIYDKTSDTTATFGITNVNTNIIIRAKANIIGYNITYALTDITASFNEEEIAAGEICYIMFYPNEGTVINNFVVSMSGNDITNTAWNPNTNVLYIENVIGNILITASVAPATTIDIVIPNLNYVFYMSFENVLANNTHIYWGDGTSTTVMGTGNKHVSHTYINHGSYRISIIYNGGWKSKSYNISEYQSMFNQGLEVEETPEYGPKNYDVVKRIYLDDYCMEIEDYSFVKCVGLEYIRLPADLIRIGDYAFTFCESLLRIVIKGNISIGASAFYMCPSLSEIYIESPNITSIGSGAFIDISENATIYIRPGAIETAITGKYIGSTTIVNNITWIAP